MYLSTSTEKSRKFLKKYHYDSKAVITLDQVKVRRIFLFILEYDVQFFFAILCKT